MQPGRSAPRRPQLLGSAERGLPVVPPPRTGTYTSPPPSSPTFALNFASTKPRHRGHGEGGGAVPGGTRGLRRGGCSLVLVLKSLHQESWPRISPGIEQGTFAKEKPRLDPASPKTWEKMGQVLAWIAQNEAAPKPRQPHTSAPAQSPGGALGPHPAPPRPSSSAQQPAGLRCRQ